ncbi:DoxX family protein [uncultured Chryseobacterium sp.]|uniref:DoxX family protein n=1 Tax=uncultured Chryseobacterium sp. TaxID=259322 RepID=UPI0025E8619D|nr:DoxX family protein [uncultured Chryseobacterium sp.]
MKKSVFYFFKLTKPVIMPYGWQDFLLALPRIICGYLLAFNFGAAKFGLPWSPQENNLRLFEVAYWFPNDISNYGGIFSLFPNFLAWMGAFSEGIGGLMLILGFQTRIMSFLIFCTMGVAAFCQHGQEGLWNMLPALAFLFVSVFTMILGSGRIGIDFLITHKS